MRSARYHRRMRTVLFLCTGNTCRSPMAEAIARHALEHGQVPGVKDSVFVASAGLAAGDGMPVSDETLEALEKIGISHEGSSKGVTAEMLRKADRVFVMTVNRAVHAFDAEGGQRLWIFERPGDALTLGQPGVLAAFRDTLLAGQGPRLTGLDPLRGTVRWEAALANPRGANEVERLADLVGPVVRVGNLVCTRSFQAGVGCADADRGAPVWTRNLGGWQPVGGDDQVLVAGDASDRVSAWRLLNGESLWSSERLLHRQLSGVAVSGRVAVAGDAQGLVHFLDKLTGEPLLRLPTDGTAVVGAPALAGTTLVVVTRAGGVFGFRPD